MEKPQEVAWVDLQVERSEVSGNHHGGATYISQVDGDSE